MCNKLSNLVYISIGNPPLDFIISDKHGQILVKFSLPDLKSNCLLLMQEKNTLQISNDMKCNVPFNFTKIGINHPHSTTKFEKVLLKNFDVLSKGVIKFD